LQTTNDLKNGSSLVLSPVLRTVLTPVLPCFLMEITGGANCKAVTMFCGLYSRPSHPRWTWKRTCADRIV